MGSRQRRREADFAQGAAQLVLFIAFVAMWFPAVRQMLFKLGVFVAWASMLALVVTLGVILIRRTERRSPFSSDDTTTLEVTAPMPRRIERTFTTPTSSQFHKINPTLTTPTVERVRPTPPVDLIEQLFLLEPEEC